MTNSIQPGLAATLTQNVVYALPPRSCIIVADIAVDVAQSAGGPWTAYVAGTNTAGLFVRCTTGNTIITAKV